MKLRVIAVITLCLLIYVTACRVAPNSAYTDIENPPAIVRITRQDDWALRGPSWAPSGGMLILEGDKLGAYQGETNLLTLDLSSNTVDLLLDQQVPRLSPFWSSTSEAIIYYRAAEPNKPRGIWKTDVLGNNESFLTVGREAIWGPQDAFITVFNVDTDPSGNSASIQIMDAHNALVETIYKISGFKSVSLDRMSWSPDGKTLLISLAPQTTDTLMFDYNLYAISSPDWEIIDIATTEQQERSPGWTSDGKWMFYTVGFDHEEQIRFRRFEDICTISPLDVIGIRDPTLSPNGQSLAFAHGWDIYLLDMASVFGGLAPSDNVQCQ